ncbi:P2X purinoceptor 4-like [Sycon ciliatum]|uniref:P2X purinoceptor 4-like n=1 Tax=Sycon ciliatum TaxID=27933 RepID=UPI0020ABF3B7|eukprot:scpid13851/ scgid33070/ P2X purinoceptor 4; ATP receptor; Purinergic receptor
MGFAATISSVLLEYDTLKVVHIKSKKVGIINRLIQVVIIAYIIGYVIVYKKGYQDTEEVEGAVTAKLKGAAYPLNAGLASRVWDAADYHIPPQQTGAFFVMTNMIITPDQRNMTCPESLKNAKCYNASDCPSGQMVPAGNGLMTGRCIPYDSYDSDTRHDVYEEDFTNGSAVNKTCEIIGWCPLEKDVTPSPARLGNESMEFTVLIKNSIIFRKFDVRRRNIPSTSTEKWLKKCRYSPDHPQDKYCPIIKLYNIFKYAGVADQWDDAAKNGAVISIDINWSCNLDHDEDECNPKYTFRRLDNPDVALSPGFNFRYSQYHSDVNGEKTRTLIKAYGILFDIKISGEAGKFSPVPLLVNLGSGLALLSVATIMCDFVVLHFLKKRQFYHEKKFEDVEVQDDLLPEGLLSPSERDSLIQKH